MIRCSEGVVLIDEIELHLYPRWQRRILPALERAFPGCQLIVSTHSPKVLGHVDHEAGVHPDPEGDRRGGVAPRSLRAWMWAHHRRPARHPARPEGSSRQSSREMFKRLDDGDLTGARALHGENHPER
ncbi:MAG: AAA family ATPase [Byssovorax sp.]